MMVPFHMWAPDIYEGAPTPVAAFVAVISKIAIFALLLRYFALMDGYQYPSLLRVIALVAILSMLTGDLLALLQNNVKRISDIVDCPFRLRPGALLAGSTIAIEAASYYLTAYVVTTIGAFGVVTLLSQPGEGREADQLDSIVARCGRTLAAGAFTLPPLSLAGFPLNDGIYRGSVCDELGRGNAAGVAVAALVIGPVTACTIICALSWFCSSLAPGTASSPVRLVFLVRVGEHLPLWYFWSFGSRVSGTLDFHVNIQWPGWHRTTQAFARVISPVSRVITRTGTTNIR